ncbi:phosphatidylinositol-glycan biosynthesis class X protein isoform X2 [Amia ocellicauda]|uniref:phosphatidylinositol-glycan biosynthesis class X protein isoform X2 n=1 Tax=Amia ocellicauda TaxID=2972642 RepID=UPI003464A9A7
MTVQCTCIFSARQGALWPYNTMSGVNYRVKRAQERRFSQVLLDSDIDLEAPAYVSSGFSALVYPLQGLSCSRCFQATVPIHCRYQRPSGSGDRGELIHIQSPKLLLRAPSCQLPLDFPPQIVTDAPCSALNHSMCSWLEIHYKQDPGSLTLEIPVGDKQLAESVCAGTLLVTLLCCGLIGGAVWKHLPSLS